MNIGTLNLNLVPARAHQKVRVNYGDVGSILTLSVSNGDAMVDLGKMTSVTCKGTKDDGLGFSVTCTTADELARTDYKLYKYMDGSLSEEDYAPIKAQRQAWRDRINELEALITNPTITQEEMIKAEEAALAKKE